MNRILGTGLALLAALVVGFVAGRASGGVDDPSLQAELELWKRDARGAIRERDSSRLVIVGLREAFQALEGSMNRILARAAASEVKAGQHGRRADSLMAQLARALTPRDSAAILVNACSERGLECANLRTANADLRLAIDTSNAGKGKLKEEIAVHVDQRSRDSTRLFSRDSLVGQLERAVRGCRLPLVSIPCPVLVGEYSLDDQAFRAGGAVPLKIGRLGTVMFSVTTRVAGRKP